MTENLEKIIGYLQKNFSEGDVNLVKKAYEFADQAHRGQKRLSGDLYISHPLAVAQILVQLEQGPVAIAASLLHDVLEDTGVTEEKISKAFGKEILTLVIGVTKLKRFSFVSKEEHQAEGFRKMILAMAQDIRVIIIKLADRFHNMQTIEFLPKEKQKETALETRDIFAPLAHRLGIWSIKWQLEDYAFQVLNETEFKKIKERVARSRIDREEYIKNFISLVEKELIKISLKAQIQGRPKHFFSIYQKLVSQHLEFSDLYDLTAIRIIVDSIKDCYTVLGIVHAAWKPISGKFNDYIAVPKSNLYQSLHTTIIGPAGHPIEIQIRTQEMHKFAEYGVAAHWKYKEKKDKTTPDKDFESKLSWLRQLIEWQKDLKDARAFMEGLKIDLFVDEVFVFTPKGDLHDLPLGSTPVDFAYHVHTEVGHRCVGAKTNGRLVPLNYQLKNGDIIEIITSKENHPSLDWLNYVKTPAARTKIKHYFSKLRKEETVNRGKEELHKEMRKLWIESQIVLDEILLKSLLKELNLTKEENLYAAIGRGELAALSVVRKLKDLVSDKTKTPETETKIIPTVKTPKKNSLGINVEGVSDILVKLSRCCTPVFGDEIIGFITFGHGVSIHRSICKNITNIEDKKRLIKVEWVIGLEINYPAEIEIEAFDRIGLLRDILAQISETKTNIDSAQVFTKKRGGSAFIKLVIDVKNRDHLNQVLQEIRSVSDVYDAKRAY